MADQTLARIDLLGGLTPAERQAVERRCRWRRHGAGEQIIDRETDTHDVYFVVSGNARVVNFALSGREVSFDDIATGGYFGELAAIDGQRRSATVVAALDTLTASLPGPVFLEVLAQHPAVALALMRRLATVIRQSTGRIMDLSTQGAHNRIYAELLREAKANAVEDNRSVIRPLPTHTEIAARVSTTRETVARTLAVLARKRLVKREGRALVLLDVKRLREMVEEFRAE